MNDPQQAMRQFAENLGMDIDSPYIGTTYAPDSLRRQLPEQWDYILRGTNAGTVRENNTLAIHSIIYGYASSDLESQGIKPEVAKFIKEHARASLRLKALAICAYEHIAACYGYNDWSRVGPPMYLCLTSYVSSLDAFACLLWGIMHGSIYPSDKNLPDLRNIACKLPNLGTIRAAVRELRDAPWAKDMALARNLVVHRGFWPSWKPDTGLLLKPEEGLFQSSSHVGHSDSILLPLHQHMRSFIKGMENWEREHSALIEQFAAVKTDFKKGYIYTFTVPDWSRGITDPSGESKNNYFDTAEEYVMWRKEMKAKHPIEKLEPGVIST